MRTLLPFLLILFIFGHSEAKKVKFSVDMAGYTISPMGIHVTGSFQEVAGFPGGDWQPDTSPMTNETGTEIYSIVVNIPAHTMYEYRFINGDQWYETEFVPVESRVGYDFNDSRWVYVDSLDNDTLLVGPVLFGGNAPAGKFLVRLLVNMEGEGIVNPSGVHVAGDFSSWNADKNFMYNFEGTIHETILWLEQGIYEFKYYNGNSLGYSEIVPGACASNASRTINVEADTVLEAVCFSQCGPCVTDIQSNETAATDIKIFPNPVNISEPITISCNRDISKIIIYDHVGKLIYVDLSGKHIQYHTNHFASGIYNIVLIIENSEIRTEKVIFR